MIDETVLTCPYCFERVEVYVDPSTEGELVQDCDVCCRPWALRVRRDGDGELLVEIGRLG